MSPPVAIIVGAVVATTAVGFLVTKVVWPHVQPQVEEWYREFQENRHRRREQAHSYSNISHNDKDDSDAGGDYETRTKRAAEGRSSAFRGQDSDFTTLRHRTQPGTSTAVSNEKLFDLDVEMVDLNKSKNFVMTDSSTRPPSTMPTYVDENPFIEPSVPIGVAIPLPLSPSSSILAETTPSVSTSQLPSMHQSPRGPSPFSPPPSQHILNSPLNSPPKALSPSPAPPASSQNYTLASPNVRPSRHNPSSSTSSFGVLGPAPISGASITAGGTIRSPAVRAASPAGMSDSMISMVSATPSRNWTEAGTADIFSGSERDFRDTASDDDDVKSVSDSGSWEDVEGHPVGSAPGPGFARPT